MNNDEKKCPLTQLICYGERCGMWHDGKCAAVVLAEAMSDIYWVRRTLEDRL